MGPEEAAWKRAIDDARRTAEHRAPIFRTFGKITKKIGRPYPDVFYGIRVTTEVIYRRGEKK